MDNQKPWLLELQINETWLSVVVGHKSLIVSVPRKDHTNKFIYLLLF